MLAVMILEDMAESARALEAIVQSIPGDIRAFYASTVEEAKRLLASGQSFDLFFLDVNMSVGKRPDMEGIRFAKYLRQLQAYQFTPIVFITSISELELLSYREVQCYRYITKPFSREEIEAIVKKVKQHEEKQEVPQITIKKDGVNYRIRITEIILIEAIPRGTRLYLSDEQVDVKYMTLRQVMELLPQAEFLQIHRMYCINCHRIEYADLVNQLVRMKGIDRSIEIGGTYKNELRKRLHEMG